MRSVSAREAKYGFGRLIDMARAEPVTVEKHGRPVVVVVAVEEWHRLKLMDAQQLHSSPDDAITVAPNG